MNTGFLLHFPKLCFGCVFHKTRASITFFFISFNESQGLKILKASDTNSLVQIVCESVTKTINSNETEYYIQFVLCTCQLDKAEKQKILKCHKSSEQKREIAAKRRNSYAQLGPFTKRICLDRFHRYYKDEKQKILNALAEKYKSMDAKENQEELAKRREAYQNMKSKEKENTLTKKRKLASNVTQGKAITHYRTQTRN